jgi:hypothetical protein
MSAPAGRQAILPGAAKYLQGMYFVQPQWRHTPCFMGLWAFTFSP